MQRPQLGLEAVIILLIGLALPPSTQEDFNLRGGYFKALLQGKAWAGRDVAPRHLHPTPVFPWLAPCSWLYKDILTSETSSTVIHSCSSYGKIMAAYGGIYHLGDGLALEFLNIPLLQSKA